MLINDHSMSYRLDGEIREGVNREPLPKEYTPRPLQTNRMMALGKSLSAVFIDYRAAFDSVSHKYVDKALKRAGASAKVRSMYRTI